jgi:hypothetical protein
MADWRDIVRRCDAARNNPAAAEKLIQGADGLPVEARSPASTPVDSAGSSAPARLEGEDD